MTPSGPEKRAGLDPEGSGSPSRFFSNDVRKPDLVFLEMRLSVCPDDGLEERDTRHQERLHKKIEWFTAHRQTAYHRKDKLAN